MAVPRVVPQQSDFNYLQCQTSLTALTGAKGIFLRCQTATTNAGDRVVCEPGYRQSLPTIYPPPRRALLSSMLQRCSIPYNPSLVSSCELSLIFEHNE